MQSLCSNTLSSWIQILPWPTPNSGALTTTSENGPAEEAARKAYDLRDRVNELERFNIDTGYYGLITGEVEKEIETYELWKQTYPRDWTPRNTLALDYAFVGKFEQAIEEGCEALRLNPDHSYPYGNLGWGYIRVGRYDEAKATFESASKKKVDDVVCHGGLLQIAFVQGDAAEMQRQAAWGKGTLDEGSMLFDQANAAAFSGRLVETRRITREAVEKENFKEAAARHAAVEAQTEADFGNYTQARQQAVRALAIARGRDSMAIAAEALAISGDVNQARGLARELGAAFPKDSLINRLFPPFGEQRYRASKRKSYACSPTAGRHPTLRLGISWSSSSLPARSELFAPGPGKGSGG